MEERGEKGRKREGSEVRKCSLVHQSDGRRGKEREKEKERRE